MANLAIKGHATRGKEVIEILEMLGGTNSENCWGVFDTRLYLINAFGFIEDISLSDNSNYQIYTLEEFLEKYPYKVGDKVKVKETGKDVTIESMSWRNGCEVVYETCYNNDCVAFYSAIELQPYKEETMEDYLITEEDYGKTFEVEQEYIDAAEMLMKQLAEGTHWKCGEFDAQKMIAMFLKKNKSMITEKEESIIVDIPKGYEFAGVDDDNQQVVFTKIQPHYPKTYEECCDIFNCTVESLSLETIKNFRHLIYCRNVYWKIAGEQMGLGKPWEPDWDDENEFKYGLYHFRNGIMYDGSCINPTLLAFPTAEIRDAFYENFKELINQCKELL